MKLAAKRSTNETTVEVDLARAPPNQPPQPDVSLSWDAHGGLDEPLAPAMAEHLFLALLAHAGVDGSLTAKGDLAHHVIEDAAITLGEAIHERVRNEPVARFADATIPMDEALVHVVLDAGDRAFYHGGSLSEYSPLFDHVCRSIAHNAHATLHVRVLRGGDRHHVVEATLKALGRALATALAPAEHVQSTKGRAERDA